MRLTEKKLKKRLSLVTQKLYATKEIKGAPKHEMQIIEAPIGALVIAPHTMSKKDFNSLLLKWILCMEKEIKKRTKNKKPENTFKTECTFNGKKMTKKQHEQFGKALKDPNTKIRYADKVIIETRPFKKTKVPLYETAYYTKKRTKNK